MATQQEDQALGIRHQHQWQTISTRPALQSAHDSMRWDVAKSRILSVEICTVCNEHHVESVSECTTEGCQTHSICARPHR